MLPEQPRADLALWRRQADLSPQGTQSTGLLQAFIRFAKHPSFHILLPRVHAADVTAVQTQPAQIPSLSSPTSNTTTDAPVPHISKPTTLARHLSKPELLNTGWERIKDLFDRDATHSYSEELTNVIRSGIAGAFVGFVYGGLPGARHAKERYIQLNQAEIYTSRVDAVRSSHNAAIRGFVRYGWRWSWRVAAFVTLFNSISTGLSVYRDEYTPSHYVAAGAVTGGLFRLNLGLMGLTAGTIIGAAMGFPAGLLIPRMQNFGGESIRERRRRERRELYELRVAEWTARMQLTDDLIGDLGVINQSERVEEDIRRIQELLTLPPNEAVAQDNDSQ